MGTVRWDLAKVGNLRGSGPPAMVGEFVASGVTTTNASTATVLDDGAAGAGSDITAVVGQVLTVVSDELGRLKLGGGTATVNSGFVLQAGISRSFEITVSGTMSVFDDA